MQLSLLQPNLKVIAGTGHRPDKLARNCDPYSPLLTERLTDLAIWYLRRECPDKVISGTALGWDIALGIAALRLEIPLIAAVPFKGQEKLWKLEDQYLYHNVLEQCEQVTIVCDGGYEARKMMIRNKWMVDRCTQVVALYDGYSSGGTANCVKYAVYKNVPIDNLWDTYLKTDLGY